MRASSWLLVVSVAVTALKVAGQSACSCNGVVNSDGQGGQNCQSTYQGKKYCYVDQGKCRDQKRGTSSSRYWSYEACRSTSSAEACPRSPVVKGLSYDCCTPEQPCRVGEGDCNSDAACNSGLKCGEANCAQFRLENYARANCCYAPTTTSAPVYQLSARGQIECSDETDCPPPYIPSTQSLPSYLTVPELQVEGFYCDYGNYEGTTYGKVCQKTSTNYCLHEVTRNHPECQRCRRANNCPPPAASASFGSTPTILSTVSSVSTLALDHLRPSPQCIAGLCRCRGRCRTKCCRLQAGGWGRNKFPVCPRTC